MKYERLCVIGEGILKLRKENVSDSLISFSFQKGQPEIMKTFNLFFETNTADM